MEINVRWQIRWPHQDWRVILTSRNKTLQYYDTSKHFNSRLDFRPEGFALLINKTQKQDTGLYQLELTSRNGDKKNIEFQVSIFESLLTDKVEKPQLQGQTEILPGGKCRVFLNCLVSGADNVNFTWHSGREQIQGWKKQTYQEEVAINSSLVYTCNVSNAVSWATSTLNLTQDCLNPSVFGSLPLLIISTVVPAILAILFVIFTVCFCVRKKKMKQSVSPAGLIPKKSPTLLYLVSEHEFSYPHKTKLTFQGPSAGEGYGRASLSSQQQTFGGEKQKETLSTITIRLWYKAESK
ncbi:natural killer cell receptor 2B4 [Talpa occidentalis]|uniref:natural killer cell receptor 2B4 n=1 Tax=Talpa occidentalis TaxID=50954 RepID=UPI0023F87772|nr:natural killer cell receptor 2B4 [Talpa occidentalis]